MHNMPWYVWMPCMSKRIEKKTWNVECIELMNHGMMHCKF